MPKRISDVNGTPIRVVIVTLDNHLAGVVTRVQAKLRRSLPGLTLSLHAASDWDQDDDALARCRADIARGDIVLANMLFMDEHVQAVLPALSARRDACDAMVCTLSAGEVIKLTRLGKFRMDGGDRGPLALLKRLRGARSNGAPSSGAKQMAMLKRIPKLLRFIPGTAQHVRAYFLAMQYWLAGSEANIEQLVRFLVDGFADGERRDLRGTVQHKQPADYPDVGLYHPRAKAKLTADMRDLPTRKGANGTVGLLIMRSYVLAGNCAHYDAVIEALEARGLNVIPAFASGLDARPAIERYFMDSDKVRIDALVSLTGFSLVGGPAYNDTKAAEETLRRLDVPYLAAHAIEFQSLESWRASDRGLSPVEATMMVAIPELDGATGPMIFGGRSESAERGAALAMQPEANRIAVLAARTARLIALRRKPAAERKLAIVLFNFPPNAGNTGTAAFLSVYRSLFNTLKALKRQGYDVDLPRDEDDLRARITQGNAARHGMHANVHARIASDDHIRSEPYLSEIEAQWGPAPGRAQSDGSSIFVLGAQFGNVFVGVQPAFGYEGDPMRLLFEKGFAPTHAFSAFYRYLRDNLKADAVLHFGTHGALEFMPGKQAGLSDKCWPDRLIGDLPNVYFYAVNNPSEGAIAKRRSAATLVSYLTPSLAHAGLYKGLNELKSSLERWRGLDPDAEEERQRLAALIRAQAEELELAKDGRDDEALMAQLSADILELEYALIPHGLHVAGEPMSRPERIDTLAAIAEARLGGPAAPVEIEALADGNSIENERLGDLSGVNAALMGDHEVDGLLHALDGRFVPPSPSGDLVRMTDILPTGRNPHGFDPFRIPSAYALADGAAQADLLLARHARESNRLPETVALVLWGTDNLKSQGGPIGQALALIGAKPRFDAYGRLCGAALVSLEELARPRIDVVMTLSGIFRDLLPLQTKLLAEASLLAAKADEDEESNFVRKHALAYASKHGVPLDIAAMRVFSNADGAYGSNVNHLIDASAWDDGDELAETYTSRKCFAYGLDGKATKQAALLNDVLASVDLAYQNLESVELGVTTIDHYFDTLGGISRAVSRARGGDVPVYIGDQTRGSAKVRTLTEQVALETRTRALNPKWYEGMLAHGFEGVRHIEAHVTNTMGWSATTGQVQPWVYQQLTETFILDPAMRERLAKLNPTASARVANRLIEAHERNYWLPDAATLQALRSAGEDLEDRLEGVGVEVAA